MASMFQSGISQSTKCAVRDGFCRDSHILCTYVMLAMFYHDMSGITKSVLLSYSHVYNRNALINIMLHYASPRRCWGKGGDLNYAKFKCTIYWAFQSVKSQPSLYLKDGDLRGDLLVNVHTSVHAYDERSNSPCGYRASFYVKSKSNAPTFPYIAWKGGSGTEY